jgi:two-component system, OmpR family, response regulator
MLVSVRSASHYWPGQTSLTFGTSSTRLPALLVLKYRDHAMNCPSDNISPDNPICTVLLVEDSQVLTERLAEAVQHVEGAKLLGCVATEAGAIAALKQQAVDVLILDLHLKQGTGFGVMRAIAGSARKPKVIVLTNYDLPEYKKAALDLGADHFLDKARDYGRVGSLLQEICRH